MLRKHSDSGGLPSCSMSGSSDLCPTAMRPLHSFREGDAAAGDPTQRQWELEIELLGQCVVLASRGWGKDDSKTATGKPGRRCTSTSLCDQRPQGLDRPLLSHAYLRMLSFQPKLVFTSSLEINFLTRTV